MKAPGFNPEDYRKREERKREKEEKCSKNSRFLDTKFQNHTKLMNLSLQVFWCLTVSYRYKGGYNSCSLVELKNFASHVFSFCLFFLQWLSLENVCPYLLFSVPWSI